VSSYERPDQRSGGALRARPARRWCIRGTNVRRRLGPCRVPSDVPSTRRDLVGSAGLCADAGRRDHSQRGDSVPISLGVTCLFADPVAAFGNIGVARRDGGQPASVCWRGLLENDWISVPGGRRGPACSAPRSRRPDCVRALRVRRRPSGRRPPPSCRISVRSRSTGARAALARQATSAMRSTSSRARASTNTVLDSAPPDAVGRAVDAARGALASYELDDGVILDSSAWLVRATQGSAVP